MVSGSGSEVVMRKLYQALCKFEEVLCGTGFIFLVFFVFLSAFLRLFRISMAWNIDLALLLLAWTAFLGADIAWRTGRLVGIDLITNRFPPMFQKIIQLIIYIIILCALIIIIIFGTRLSWTERLRKFQSLPIPYSLVTMSLVTAALSMSVSTIVKIRRCVLSFRQDEKQEVPK